MATISKFYLLDAASPNTGTLPSNSPTTLAGGVLGAGTEATGNTTARDATDVAGTSNPDIESSITAAATTSLQRLGHRRYVSRPLAAQVFPITGNWTFSYARSESNTNHNGQIRCQLYCWRPSTGAQVLPGTTIQIIGFAMTATAETADSVTGSASNFQITTQDGDVIVFDVFTQFTQSMTTAYTDQFAYNGTTEASTTTCASFVTPPATLTLAPTAAVSDTPQTYMDKRLTSRRRVIRVVQ